MRDQSVGHFDKACGRGFIAESKKCKSTKSAASKKALSVSSSKERTSVASGPEKGSKSGPRAKGQDYSGLVVTASSALLAGALLAREYSSAPLGYQQALVSHYQDALDSTGLRTQIPRISKFVEGLTSGSPSDIERKAAIGFHAAAKMAAADTSEDSSGKLKGGKDRLAYSQDLLMDPSRQADYKLALSKFAEREEIPPYPEELAAIYYYSDTVGYKEMNMTLRGQGKELNKWLKTQGWRPDENRSPEQVEKDARRDIGMAVSGLERLPPYEGKTYRGLNLDQSIIDGIEEGGDWIEKGFTSTTKTATTRYPGNVVFVVNGKGTGRDISSFEKYKNDEVLYPPGANFSVTKKRKVEKLGKTFWIVEMEEKVKAQKADKACGNGFIPDRYNCGKGEKSSRPGLSRVKLEEVGISVAAVVGGVAIAASFAASKEARTRLLLGGAGMLAMSGLLLGIKVATEADATNLPKSKIPPKKPPEGLYDSFVPGDIVYQGVPFFGGVKAHYGVYVGKVDGHHTIFDSAGDKDRFGSILNLRRLDRIGGSSFVKGERVSKDRPVPSSEQLLKIAEELKGTHFDWTGFKQNCETLARTVANDLPVSTGTKSVSALTSKITETMFDYIIERKAHGYKRTSTKQSTVKRVVIKAMKDSMISPKERAELILRPLVRKPVKVISLSLSPEEKPIGVFKATAPNGQQHYYSFKLGNTVEFGRIVQDKTDATDDECDCDKCKGKSMNSKTSVSKQLLDCQKRAYEIVQRIDKKCGASGIPETATCSKPMGNTLSKSKREGRGTGESLVRAGAALALGGASLAAASFVLNKYNQTSRREQVKKRAERVPPVDEARLNELRASEKEKWKAATQQYLNKWETDFEEARKKAKTKI